jgi:secondary thiamine-phosphate synthase enzyme
LLKQNLLLQGETEASYPPYFLPPMRQHQQVLKLQTTGKSLCRVTQKIQAIVAESQIETGLCTLFLRHTSASLVIQENADPDVLKDLENFFAKLVPEWENYIHSTEGPDDMPAHIRYSADPYIGANSDRQRSASSRHLAGHLPLGASPA